MKRRAPKVNGIRIVRADRVSMLPENPPTYWNESRRDWVRDDGTHYKSIAAAREAMKKFKLTDRAVVTL